MARDSRSLIGFTSVRETGVDSHRNAMARPTSRKRGTFTRCYRTSLKGAVEVRYVSNSSDAPESVPEPHLSVPKPAKNILSADPSRSHSDQARLVYHGVAIGRLDDARKSFERGDRMALLDAIRTCAHYGVVIPEWVCSAYIKACESVLFAQVGSWDEAFGRPFDGKYMSRRRALRDSLLVTKAQSLIDSGSAIGQALAEAARDHHVSPKRAEQIFYKYRPSPRPRPVKRR